MKLKTHNAVISCARFTNDKYADLNSVNSITLLNYWMLAMLYVLMKTEDSGGGTPLGVFDTPNINEQEIYEYFGVFHYNRNEDFFDIRDSGLEWQLTITTADKEKHTLTLHYFVLNEI